MAANASRGRGMRDQGGAAEKERGGFYIQWFFSLFHVCQSLDFLYIHVFSILGVVACLYCIYLMCFQPFKHKVKPVQVVSGLL